MSKTTITEQKVRIAGKVYDLTIERSSNSAEGGVIARVKQYPGIMSKAHREEDAFSHVITAIIDKVSEETQKA